MKTLLVSLAVMLLCSCEKEYPKKVRYVVNCASCDLTYANPGEDTEQRSMTSTWTYEFAANQGQFLYISAQNNNAGGTVEVRIDADGKTIDRAQSSGAYVIASASISLP